MFSAQACPEHELLPECRWSPHTHALQEEVRRVPARITEDRQARDRSVWGGSEPLQPWQTADRVMVVESGGGKQQEGSRGILN